MRRYYEFALAVVIVGVLALVLMDRIERTQGEFEEAAVQAEAGAIRAQVLEVLAHRETFGGPLPASDNPADWLATPLANYRGAFDAAPEAVSVWYFDRRQKVLVYRFRDGHAARFRLSHNAGRTGSPVVLAGIGLQRLDDLR